MNILTSNAHFRQRVIKKSYKVGMTETSKYYRISRNAIYEWRAKYNKKSNNILKICLGFLTPNKVLDKHLGVM